MARHTQAGLFPRVLYQKYPECPSTGEWMNKFHTMEYYAAAKKEETLIHTVAWMQLPDMTYKQENRHKRVGLRITSS